MSGIVGSKLNIRGSGLVGSLGTDGQHLLSAGAGVTNVFETVTAAAGGAWTKIESQTASDDAYITFSTFSTDYIDFRVIGTNVVPETDAQDFWCQLSTDGAFLTTSYQFTSTGSSQSAVVRDTGGSNASNITMDHSTLGNEAGENLYFEVTVSDVHDTTNLCVVQFRCAYVNAPDAHIEQISGGGKRLGTVTAIDGIRFRFASGDVATGELTLYGRKVT